MSTVRKLMTTSLTPPLPVQPGRARRKVTAPNLRLPSTLKRSTRLISTPKVLTTHLHLKLILMVLRQNLSLDCPHFMPTVRRRYVLPKEVDIYLSMSVRRYLTLRMHGIVLPPSPSPPREMIGTGARIQCMGSVAHPTVLDANCTWTLQKHIMMHTQILP